MSFSFERAMPDPVKRKGGTLRTLVATTVIVFSTLGHAAPPEFVDACYVRAETPSPNAGGAIGPMQSYLGLRRKGTQLVEVSVAVAGANGAVCSVAGTAKVLGTPGAEYLSFVVRPDSGPAAKVPCQLRVQVTSTSVELATSEASCQSLCGGQVQLSGQRFELSARVPDGVKGPCFAPSAP